MTLHADPEGHELSAFWGQLTALIHVPMCENGLQIPRDVEMVHSAMDKQLDAG